MTQEEMQKMTRKEWRAYSKRMKVLAWKDKKFPQQTTLEEMRELTDWHLESAMRNYKSAEVFQNVAIVFLIIGGIANVVTIVFLILNVFLILKAIYR